ncbi:unnamed protein product [Heterosigma akashiwo]
MGVEWGTTHPLALAIQQAVQEREILINQANYEGHQTYPGMGATAIEVSSGATVVRGRGSYMRRWWWAMWLSWTSTTCSWMIKRTRWRGASAPRARRRSTSRSAAGWWGWWAARTRCARRPRPSWPRSGPRGCRCAC